LLALQGLSAGYGGARVLNQLDLQLYPNETLVVMGRNGVGKTTLVETIMGLTDWHAGSMVFDGQAIERWPTHLRNRAGIGWVPQQREVFPSLTVEENLTVIARAGEWSVERVYELFPRLAERKTNLGTQLSGGEQQMLAVGRALVLNPTLLLLDEPCEGLAPIIVQELLRAIRRITREEGLSAIIVEQHPQAILAISDTAAVLDRGTVVYTGTARSLQDQPELLDKLLGVAR
jgi:branched-chain amino acid transport system ATP-binding protein